MKSPLEARIITSFLQAADYELVELASLRYRQDILSSHLADVGITVMESPASELDEACGLLREAAGWEEMPIVALVPEETVQEEDGLFLLVRPIRLFELVDAVWEAMLYGRSTRSEGSRSFRTTH